MKDLCTSWQDAEDAHFKSQVLLPGGQNWVSGLGFQTLDRVAG